ncbi:MAG TPA: T9SS type A sorting domain-containing protein [Bacteroidales bacterium]|nr:T9SS type A sorting domain-containing protein [Bacteroidales bacterium]
MKIYQILLLGTLILLKTGTVFTQEVITGLSHNPVIAQEAKTWKSRDHKNAIEPIKLPFIHDFSNYIGYPDQNIFLDRQGFVNTSFAIRPPSIGVVTLDAIDENGAIYAHANSSGFHADTLTSHFIRLDSIFTSNRPITIQDSIYFSFYYQPAGGSESSPIVQWERIGNRPETQDLLMLDFGFTQNGITTWNNVWSTDGLSLDDWLDSDPNKLTFFKQVMIPIVESYYLVDSFQFRFRNMASLENNGVTGWESNVDQWNLDYFRLDINRTIDDIYPNDIAFVAPTTSCITPYHSVPWSHFSPTMMKDKFENKMSNLSNIIRNASYNYYVVKNFNQNIYTYTCNNENIEPYYNNGLQDYSFHANPDIEFTITPDGADSAVYTITHIHKLDGAIGDNLSANDTIVYHQKFTNFFAYDDGTAEAGYSIYTTQVNPNTYLAMKYSLQHPDTLRAVKIWFNKTLNNVSVAPFKIMVWAEGIDNKPGALLYQMDAQVPQYSSDFLTFATYYLDEPVPITGTFYVGIYQNHNVQLNIGYDQNTDSRKYFTFKTTTTWEQPIVKGTPMIRAIVGEYLTPQNIQESQISDISVYPIPAYDVLNIHFSNQIKKYPIKCLVFDIYGKNIVILQLENEYVQIPIGHLSSGIYIIKFINNINETKTIKFLKQ